MRPLEVHTNLSIHRVRDLSETCISYAYLTTKSCSYPFSCEKILVLCVVAHKIKLFILCFKQMGGLSSLTVILMSLSQTGLRSKKIMHKVDINCCYYLF